MTEVSLPRCHLPGPRAHAGRAGGALAGASRGCSGAELVLEMFGEHSRNAGHARRWRVAGSHLCHVLSALRAGKRNGEGVQTHSLPPGGKRKGVANIQPASASERAPPAQGRRKGVLRYNGNRSFDTRPSARRGVDVVFNKEQIMNDTPTTQSDLDELDRILDCAIPTAGRRITDTWRLWLETGQPDPGNWRPDRKRILEISRARERNQR